MILVTSLEIFIERDIDSNVVFFYLGGRILSLRGFKKVKKS